MFTSEVDMSVKGRQLQLLFTLLLFSLLSKYESENWGSKQKNLECETIESIAVELLVNGKKWLISGKHRPQAISDNELINDFTKIYDKISVKFDNMIVLGDLNYDLLSLQKR
jgi:hypothetical protein